MCELESNTKLKFWGKNVIEATTKISEELTSLDGSCFCPCACVNCYLRRATEATYRFCATYREDPGVVFVSGRV